MGHASTTCATRAFIVTSLLTGGAVVAAIWKAGLRPRGTNRPVPSTTSTASLSGAAALKLAIEHCGATGSLPGSFAADLLRSEDASGCLHSATSGATAAECVVLERPFYNTLARRLEQCRRTGVWPSLPDAGEANAELASLELDLGGSIASWQAAATAPLPCGGDRSAQHLILAVEACGAHGIQTLLGQRTTAGSVVGCLPPSRCELVAAFEARHRPDVGGCLLSVGGRALAKHAHRGVDSFWARATSSDDSGNAERGKSGKNGMGGDDASKNAAALRALEKVLGSACWANTHGLPGQVLVHELRNREGYGVRWAWGGSSNTMLQFRGFLEPQMADGHQKKWRH